MARLGVRREIIGPGAIPEDKLEGLLAERPRPPIKGTSFFHSKAERVYDQDLLDKAIFGGIVRSVGGAYEIPLRDPTDGKKGMKNPLHGRSIHTPQGYGLRFVFLGAGEGGLGDLSFEYDRRYILAQHRFRGALDTKEDRYRVDAHRMLIDAFRNAKDEPFMAEARKHGVTEEMFLKPVASFIPEKLPVRVNGIIEHLPRDDALRRGEVPDDLKKSMRVQMYAVTIPERISEFKDIKEDDSLWERAFGEYGYGLELSGNRPRAIGSHGKPVGYKEAAGAVLNGAAARYGVWNKLVQDKLGGTSSKFRYMDDDDGDIYLVGSTFQSGEMHPNVNPLNIFDYGAILIPGRNMSEDRDLLRIGRENDEAGARQMIGAIAEKLGVQELKQKAEKVYERVRKG